MRYWSAFYESYSNYAFDIVFLILHVIVEFSSAQYNHDKIICITEKKLVIYIEYLIELSFLSNVKGMYVHEHDLVAQFIP